VLVGELSPELRHDAALYAGCISGAVQKEQYLRFITGAGFAPPVIQKERRIDVPNEILLRHMTLEQLREFKRDRVGIFSITVYAEKPAA
jgi:hypothetical protein